MAAHWLVYTEDTCVAD